MKSPHGHPTLKRLIVDDSVTPPPPAPPFLTLADRMGFSHFCYCRINISGYGRAATCKHELRAGLLQLIGRH